MTYDFFVGEAVPPYPAVSPEDLDESLALLATQNEKARGFDLNTLLGACGRSSRGVPFLRP